ncbi:DNA cytosine methyltransferase [Candidatus Stoquefichus massiliensis]|uniref:DNA cytosine methyltransferase n=1 Tax=Candidatus Stoquefichus massiliensis TaxID=1470350 RepID=UPI0004B33E6D|nr:DNA cytosine methyltransferase [Candidatus Stoquefichus massiliensis]
MIYKYTSIDLFSGPGGLCTGLKWAGIKPLIAIEWSYWTVQTYAASHNADIFELDKYLDNTLENKESFFLPNNKTLLIYGDINKVTNDLIMKILKKRFNVTSVDIVTGGAPCESFSMAGSRKEDDERNSLYKNILRIARITNSKLFLFENVKGLFSKKYNGIVGEMYKKVCDDFQSKIPNMTNYRLVTSDKTTVLLKASDYGVPQSRERLFLLGINQKFPNVTFCYPKKTHGTSNKKTVVTVNMAISDLPNLQPGEENNHYSFNINEITNLVQKKYFSYIRGKNSQIPSHIAYDPSILTCHKAPGHTLKMRKRITLIRPGENMKTSYQRLVNEGNEELALQYFPKKIYAARNRRLLPHETSFTVTSHCLDEMLHPFQDRGLTPREVARLQSFPDWYQFRGPFVKFHSDPDQDLYEQIGDAIPPLLAYALGKEIVKTLKQIYLENNL